jgi:hypothetical protein
VRQHPAEARKQAKGGVFEQGVLMKKNTRWGALFFPLCLPACVCSFFFFERERKEGTALLSFDDVVGETSEVDEPVNTEESPTRAGGEKGLSLRAIRGHFGGRRTT